MRYQDVIKPEMLDEYIYCHKKFFYEMTNINADLFLLEKIYSFPFKDLYLHYEELFYSLIADNTIQYLGIKIYRILEDKSNDVKTIRIFRNDLMRKYLKEEFKEDVKKRIKASGLEDKAIADIAQRIRDLRVDFFAHRNEKYFQAGFSEEKVVTFDDIKTLVLKLNDFFKAISFDVEDKYNKAIDGDYYDPNLKAATERTFGHIFDRAMLSLVLNSEHLSAHKYAPEEELSLAAKEKLEAIKTKIFSLELEI
jgi:hypothetical protein